VPVLEVDVMGYGTYGLLMPSLDYWVQLTFLLVAQSSISVLFAVIIYKFIIPNRGSTQAYLLGLGVLLPVTVILPYEAIKFLNLRNRVLMFSLTCQPSLMSFRILEALFGTSPHGVELSLGNYGTYHATTLECIVDERTNHPSKATREHVKLKLRMTIISFCLLSALLSITAPSSHAPFDVRMPANTLDHGFWDLVHVGHLANNFIGAALVQLCIMFGSETLGLVLGVTVGIKLVSVFENPLLESSSPSNFWGRRWNTLIHGLLKRAIYKPTRTFIGQRKFVAVMATFLASGILHEFIWSVMFLTHGCDDASDDEKHISCFKYLPGKSFAFFAWNGIIIIFEHMVGGWLIFQRMKRTLPLPLKTALVILTALPLGHLFTGDWIESGYFSHYAMALPIVVRLK